MKVLLRILYLFSAALHMLIGRKDKSCVFPDLKGACIWLERHDADT